MFVFLSIQTPIRHEKYANDQKCASTHDRERYDGVEKQVDPLEVGIEKLVVESARLGRAYKFRRGGHYAREALIESRVRRWGALIEAHEEQIVKVNENGEHTVHEYDFVGHIGLTIDL